MKTVKRLKIDKIIELMKLESKLHGNVKNVEDGSLTSWLKGVKGEKIVYKNSTYFNTLKNLIFKSKNIDHLIALGNAEILSLDFKEIENEVLKSKKPDWCVKFLQAFDGKKQLRKREFEDIIYNSKSLTDCYNYLRYFGPIHDFDFPKFQDVIIDNGGRYTIRQFIRNIPRANISIAGKAFVDTFFDEKKTRIEDGYPKKTLAEIYKYIEDIFEYTSTSDRQLDLSEENKQAYIANLKQYASEKSHEYDIKKLIKNHKIKISTL